jgi:Protein of unknown function (DUF2865)
MARSLRISGTLITFFAMALTAAAQSPYCDSLRTELSRINGGSGSAIGGAGQDTIRTLQSDLGRVTEYYKSLSCDAPPKKLFFFTDTPRQCPDLQRQIKELQNNIATIQNEASRNADPAIESRRVNLQAALDSNCRTGQPRTAQSNRGNLLELFFGDSTKSLFDSEMPDEPSPYGLPTDEKGYGYRTICVRSCDGYYFPISNNASQRRFNLDADLCHSSCPNAETALYIVAIGQDAETAVSVDGHTPYPSLPNAFKYRRGVDPGCSCRKQGQSWSEALAESERILVQNGRSEGPISEQRAFELSRARSDGPKGKALDPTSIPTAPAATNVRAASDRMIEITDLDGSKKRIRLIVPPSTSAIPE